MTEERLASIKYHELSSHLVHPESGYADTLTKKQLEVRGGRRGARHAARRRR